MPEGLWDQILLRYGLPGLGLLFLLVNLEKIGKFFDKLLQQFFPSYEAKAKEREHRRMMEERQFAQVERERVDTVLLFKDMTLEYRKRLDDLEIDNRRERKEHEETLRNILRGYEHVMTRNEQTMAQVIEVLRDISEGQRSYTDKLNIIFHWMKQKEIS